MDLKAITEKARAAAGKAAVFIAQERARFSIESI